MDKHTENIPAYTFAGGQYNRIAELVNALGRNWQEGKRHLFSGLISKFYSNYDREVAFLAQNAEDEAAQHSGKDDVIFWRLLYRLVPDMKTFYWQGHVYASITSLGQDMLERLRRQDSEFGFYSSILEERLLSQYMQLYNPQFETLLKKIIEVEDAYHSADYDQSKLLLIYYRVAYLLSGQRTFKIANNKEFNTIGQLAEYIKTLLEFSYDQFESFCHSMVDYDDNLNPQFEAWLMTLGKQQELEQWRVSLAE